MPKRYGGRKPIVKKRRARPSRLVRKVAVRRPRKLYRKPFKRGSGVKTKIVNRYADAVVYVKTNLRAPSGYNAVPYRTNRSLTTTQVSSSINNQSIYIASFGGYGALSNMASLWSQAPTSSYVANNTAQFLWVKTISELLLTNQTTAPIKVNMYLFRCERDTSSTVIDQWQDICKFQTGGTDYSLVYGQTPDDVPDLAKFWKIVRRKQFMMSPGAVVAQKVILSMHKLFDNSILSTLTTTALYLKGYTYQVMFVLSGFPGSDLSGNVALSPARLNIVENVENFAKAVTQNTTVYSQVSLGTTSTNVSTWNEGTGAASVATQF